MSKHNEKKEISVQENFYENEGHLFEHVAKIIEVRKQRAGSFANSEVTMMYWEIGRCLGSVLLGNGRAKYGEKIVATLSQQLVEKYGNSFERTKMAKMIKFAELFPDPQIVATLSRQLSWSHFIEMLPLKNEEARMYYARDAAERNLGIRDLRKQISRKAYERREIANSQLTEGSVVPFNIFKDPYLLDTLGLKDNFLEADLEKAILSELEAFILEFGHGFTFVERQKRMVLDDEDYTLDLLFYHRILKRLVAVELKMGKFIPQYKGQMEFYLKWLNKFERHEGENEPIGLILCTKASRSQVELLEMDRSGIAVVEYWIELPPKALLEEKIKSILSDAQERLERRKLLPNRGTEKLIDYFYEPEDEGAEEK
ncbi:MAG: PDDEXK nuclease domain-containing protein [Methanomassiliicoccaceae archaeon]|nr:PDDEXK nuclease domain-containing protein [Methanomassiliicoccaceae archaeon]